uniref:Immunoglobulin domain-containing protein n=1 Tax=Chelydra serpentina TaxID=8475 RepID=A0A8C3SVS6_CHESE
IWVSPTGQVYLLCFSGYFSALTAPREVRGPLGGTVSVPCQYCERTQEYRKYWCRGVEWNSCSKVVETEKSEVEVKRGRVSITDNYTTSTFTVTMEKLTLGDAGIYWCGINIRGGSDPYSLVNVTVLPVPGSWPMGAAGTVLGAGAARGAAHPAPTRSCRVVSAAGRFREQRGARACRQPA